MAIHIEHAFVRLKSGKWSKRPHFVGVFRYCELAKCERCGKLGPTNRVRKWWYQIWDAKEDRPEPVLCLGCFNKIRPIWKCERDARDLLRLARKLGREIANVRKHQNDGTATGAADRDD